jgi:hypothetical protein
MRNAARLKVCYYPLPESEGVKLRSLLFYSQPASITDPCVGQGGALQLITKDAPARLNGVELDAERARTVSSKGIETVQGNTFDAIVRSESFSLLYLNPHYDSEIGPIANRRMEAVFLEHTYRWLAMEGMDAQPGFTRYYGLKGEEADVLERNYCAPPACFQRTSIAASPRTKPR